MNKELDLVCIIDDDPIYTFAIKKLLKINNISSNYIVYTNGKDALEGLTNNPGIKPDLILLDINMPIMNGWQFLDAYKDTSLLKTTPLYIISSSIIDKELTKAKKKQFS